MVLSYKWLSEFVNTDVSPKEFADSMTMSGSKVERCMSSAAKYKTSWSEESDPSRHERG